MKNPFRKEFVISLNRVYDKVCIREGGEKLTLTVNGDAQRMVAGLTNAQKRMQAITDETAETEIREISEYFSTVIFGKEQTEKLFAFYADDPASVISVCGQYFKNRLAGKIAEAQKKIKV